MVFYCLLFLVLLLTIRLPEWVNSSAVTMSVITLSSLVLIFVLTYQVEWFSKILERLIEKLPLRFREKGQLWRESGLSSLAILKSRWDLIKIVFWSAIIWITAVLTNQLCMLALNIHLPITASILVLILLQISMSLPSVPGRIGIFEYLCVLALGVFNIPEFYCIQLRDTLTCRCLTSSNCHRFGIPGNHEYDQTASTGCTTS